MFNTSTFMSWLQGPRGLNSSRNLLRRLADLPDDELRAATETLRGNQRVHRVLQEAYGVRVTDPDFSDHVQVSCAPDLLAKLQERVGKQWQELGEKEPYWSVLTAPQFLKKVLDQAKLKEFFASGEAHAAQLDELLQRFGIHLPEQTVIDFGCGVGRISLHLLERGYRVTGVDISPGNLALAQERLRAFSESFRAMQITAPEDLQHLDSAAVLISFITLQHNAPPIQKLLLDRLLAKIKHGGVALFQTPTFKPGYRFDAGAFARHHNPDAMDMHCLPMRRILETLHENGMRPLEILQDPWTGSDYQSHTIFAIKD